MIFRDFSYRRPKMASSVQTKNMRNLPMYAYLTIKALLKPKINFFKVLLPFRIFFFHVVETDVYYSYVNKFHYSIIIKYKLIVKCHPIGSEL